MRDKPQAGFAATTSSFLSSLANLITVKGVVLLLFLSVLTGVSAVSGGVIEGLAPGAVLTALLVLAVVYEFEQYDRLDIVGVLAVGIAAVYTVLELAGMRQGLSFPVVASLILIAASGVESWRQGSETAAEFVERLDVVGLYGGILLLVYALLLWGGQLGFIYSPVFPTVLLVFVVALLVTTIAYATRSSPLDMPSDELHHRLVSVVASLEDIDDADDRDRLGSHVLAVANALTGYRIPSSIEVSEGRVPVVLPDTDAARYYPNNIYTLLNELESNRLTGYVVDEGGNVVLLKNGTPVKYYIAEDDAYYDSTTEIRERGIFEEARVYTAAYTFVDAVESLTPTVGAGTSVELAERSGDDWAEDAVGRVEEVGGMESLVVGEEDVIDDDEAEREPEEAAEPSLHGDVDDGAGDDGSEDGDDADKPEETEENDEDGSKKTDGNTLDVGGDEIDLDEMFDKADEMFD